MHRNASRIRRVSPVYPTLAEHQVTEDWACREIVARLQEWAERFIVEFKLGIPELVLAVDDLPRTRLGQFRNGHNGLGLRGEITINRRYVSKREPWELLGTLLHELIHAWQQAHGVMKSRSHHNSEFRQKARELGLIVDRRGITGYAAASRFKDVLQTHGVEVPAGEVTPRDRRVPGTSKLVKWTCGCGINVRVGVADFQALCLKCNTKFVRDNVDQGARTIFMAPGVFEVHSANRKKGGNGLDRQGSERSAHSAAAIVEVRRFYQ
jgi:hypothetical protein